MAKYVNSKGDIITIDSADNVFMNGKLCNPKTTNVVIKDIKHNAELFRRDSPIYGFKPLSSNGLQVTGHVGEFEYGQDKQGNPIKVVTGYKSY